jgi:hypothetical protein
MTEWDHNENSDAPLDQPSESCKAIASLRLAGGEQFDPVGLHYLDVLDQRASAQPRPVKRILEAKLAKGLAAFEQRLQQAHREAADYVTAVQSIHAPPTEGLSNLIARIAGQSPGHTSGHSVEYSEERVELKSVQRFRNTWSKLSANKQVTHALDQGPKNAGPINSHMLMLRSLTLMRDISPDYLTRFVSYVDTLLCLDQADKQIQPQTKTAAVGKSRKKAASR